MNFYTQIGGCIMDFSMFCYQCEQAIGGKGCTKMGNCTKDSELAKLMDLFIYQLKGISYYAMKLLDRGVKVDQDVGAFVADGTFYTLTNTNFDTSRFFDLLKEAQSIKEELRKQVNNDEGAPEQATYNLPSDKNEILKDAVKAGIMYNQSIDQNIRSLRETIIYGLKGMGAYAHHARVLGYVSEEVDQFFFKGLNATTDDKLTVEELINMTMETGRANYKCIELLDTANTESYGDPVPTPVNVNVKKGPAIIVSGHDLRDLKMLLEQTEGKGINIYTHGEMLPCHGYPELNKYSHLVGNFGDAWQDQQKQFDGIPAAILMTTNCLMKPRDSYKDRLFTTSIVGWPDVNHINKSDDKGNKDFTPVIEKALELGGFQKDEEEKKITVGFGHKATLSNAGAIVDAVKSGKLKHFFLIGGCDGARPGRNYYTELAKQVPQDSVILTLACGKYRFNKLEFGEVAGLPRLLDVGQCNDTYSAVRIALALSEAFECDVNDLPLSIMLSWYEQKAVADLLTLLALGIKGIYLGPSIPAFLSPDVLQYLINHFDLKPISTPEEDLKVILG
jgi:hydroxylamine reductase